MLPCLVIIRRQPVPSFRSAFSLSTSPALFAKSANFPPCVFNYFQSLAPRQMYFRPLFSYSCALFCRFLHFLAPTKIATPVFSCVCALFAKKRELACCPIFPLAVPFWNASPIP